LCTGCIAEVAEAGFAALEGDQCGAQGVETVVAVVVHVGYVDVFGYGRPLTASVGTDLNLHLVALIDEAYGERSVVLYGDCLLFVGRGVELECVAAGGDSGKSLFVVEQEQAGAVVLVERNFDFYGVAAVGGRDQKEPSLGRSRAFPFYVK
jgi:hypothetical protein